MIKHVAESEMLLTEEEAKDRWCPFRRLPVIADCHCIASQCMAWQWTTAAKMGLSREGYCGLAGNPNLASDIVSQQVAAKDREAQ